MRTLMSLERMGPVRRPKQAIMVVVGADAEEDYVHWLKRVLDHTEIPIERAPNAAGALEIVQLAVSRKKAARKDGNNYEIWCLVNASDEVHQARVLADKSGIRLVVSDPAFATWLLMHFEDVSGRSVADVNAALRVHLPAIDSRSAQAMSPLTGRFAEAAARARGAASAGSDVHELVDVLRESLRAYLNVADVPEI